MPAAGSPGQAPMLLRTSFVQQGGRTGAARRPKRMEQPGRNLPGCFFVPSGTMAIPFLCRSTNAAPDAAEMPRFPPAAPEMHRASTNTSSVAAYRRAKTAAPVGAAVFSFPSQLARGCSARRVMRSSVGSSSASTMPFPAQMASRSGSVPNTNTGE